MDSTLSVAVNVTVKLFNTSAHFNIIYQENFFAQRHQNTNTKHKH